MRIVMARMCLLLFTVVVSPLASASFTAELVAPRQAPSFTALGVTPVTQIGQGTATMLAGSGKSVPLPQAMRMILPDGWNYSPGEGVESFAVSWQETGTWIDALHNIGDASGIRFLINWPTKTVYAESAQAAGSHATGDRTPRAVNVDAEEPRSGTWELQPGGFREQLSRWAVLAGYHVYWPERVADVWVQVPVTLKGDFLTAVRDVTLALRAAGSGLRIRAYQRNRALVVEG